MPISPPAATDYPPAGQEAPNSFQATDGLPPDSPPPRDTSHKTPAPVARPRDPETGRYIPPIAQERPDDYVPNRPPLGGPDGNSPIPLPRDENGDLILELTPLPLLLPPDLQSDPKVNDFANVGALYKAHKELAQFTVKELREQYEKDPAGMDAMIGDMLPTLKRMMFYCPAAAEDYHQENIPGVSEHLQPEEVSLLEKHYHANGLTAEQAANTTQFLLKWMEGTQVRLKQELQSKRQRDATWLAQMYDNNESKAQSARDHINHVLNNILPERVKKSPAELFRYAQEEQLFNNPIIAGLADALYHSPEAHTYSGRQGRTPRSPLELQVSVEQNLGSPTFVKKLTGREGPIERNKALQKLINANVLAESA